MWIRGFSLGSWGDEERGLKGRPYDDSARRVALLQRQRATADLAVYCSAARTALVQSAVVVWAALQAARDWAALQAARDPALHRHAEVTAGDHTLHVGRVHVDVEVTGGRCRDLEVGRRAA